MGWDGRCLRSEQWKQGCLVCLSVSCTCLCLCLPTSDLPRAALGWLGQKSENVSARVDSRNFWRPVAPSFRAPCPPGSTPAAWAQRISRLSSKGLPASQPELGWPGQGRARQPKQFFSSSLDVRRVPSTAAAAVSNDRLPIIPLHNHPHSHPRLEYRTHTHTVFLSSQPQLERSDCPALRDLDHRCLPLPVRRNPAANQTDREPLFTPASSSLPIILLSYPTNHTTNRQNECCR